MTITGGTATTTVRMPAMRISYKPKIRATLFRWSTNQQIYFKVGSSTVQNDVTGAGASDPDVIIFIDTFNDPSIIGNEILYTNGGVVENVNGPAFVSITSFDQRLWGIDAEDQNLLWYSKQVIESVPVEMSELLTYYVAPNAGAQGPTGPMTAIAPMDDKLIVFKRNAAYYINGSGPDITGANNQYTPSPIFINGSVGCINKNSIVLIPNGLMYQSDNGIWLIGRDLSTSFVGKDVEAFNTSNVLSAIYVVGTSEARFSLDTGEVLVYDYLANQWTVDYGASAVSTVVYQNKHTTVNQSGQLFQETQNRFLDGTSPVTLGFTTGWINLAGLQGYVRAYEMYLLGNFKSPHTYSVGIAYDYNPTIVQTAVIDPTNTLGSGSQVEQWNIGFNRQQCQSFQLTFTETASSTQGAGVSLSGISLVVGMKKGYPGNIPLSNRTN